MHAGIARVDQLEVRRLAELFARLSASQQRVVATVAEGFRSGWLAPADWERYWLACDLSDELACAEVMTWLVRRRRARSAC
jgi:hypothetical protein